MISCQNLTKRFGNHAAIDGASFEVSPGTICALLGPNGAGKSTLVKMLTGLLPATSGTLSVCGLQAGDRALKSIVGVLPENLALFDALTVAEHLELTGAVYGVAPKTTKSRIDQLLRILRLEHGRDTFIHQCSYGMKKKTALAMALLPNPKALFLDEPFEGIDPLTAKTIRIQLRSIAAKGITVLLTSHILSLVEQVADQVMMIDHGKIVFDSRVNQWPEKLETLYFDKIERAESEEIEWLGVDPS